ncbi:MAG: trigger factor [Acidobacteriota bacterium]|nr:trigger factor [Acidobacteriota bacterium]
MTVQIVEVSSCKRDLTAEVPAQEVNQEIETLARDYARNAKIPGFRPGKVPLSIIRQRFGSDLQKEATQKIIERCWKEAVTENKLAPLAEPTVKELDNKPGEGLKFTLSFEILPPLEVQDYKGVAVTVPKVEVTEESVNQAIENIRERNAQFVPVESEAQDGMYVTLTVQGQFDGAEKPTREDDITLIIGHPQTNEEFTKNLRGAKPNDVRMFDVSYPEDYHRKQFAGKTVHYTVLVKDIKEKQLAELNDDFAKDVGAESLESLRIRVRDELVTQAKQNAEKKAREELLDSIVQRQTVEVPECMVQDEVEAQAHRLANNLAYQGIDVRQASIDWKKIFEEERPRAEQAVRRSLFLDAIARQENIEVTSEEIDSELEKIAEGTSKSAAALRAQLEKEERIQSFEQHLRQNKALDFIYRNANITEG